MSPHKVALLEGDCIPEGGHPLLRGVLILGTEEESGGPGVGELESLVAGNTVERFSIFLEKDNFCRKLVFQNNCY